MKKNTKEIKPEKTSKVNKKSILITSVAIVGAGGLLAGGHCIASNIIRQQEENKPILEKLGGKAISFEEAKNVVNEYELKVADNVNLEANVKALSIQDGAFEKYEEGVVSESYPINLNWNGFKYNSVVSYNDMIFLDGEDNDGTDLKLFNSNESSILPQTLKLNSDLSMYMFHQTYEYMLENLNDFVTAYIDESKYTLNYLEDNGGLGIYVNINDLSTFLKSTASIDDFKFTGNGSLECGIKINKDGFVERFLLKVSGDKVEYRLINFLIQDRIKKYSNASTAYNGNKITGKFDLNLDIKLTNRTFAKAIPVSYTINGKSIEKYKEDGGRLEAPAVYIIDPFYRVDSKGQISGIELVDKSYALTNRTYNAYFLDESEKEGQGVTYEILDLENSSICIDGIDYIHSTEPLAGLVSFVKLDDPVSLKAKQYNWTISIDRSLISENHTYSVNIVTKVL